MACQPKRRMAGAGVALIWVVGLLLPGCGQGRTAGGRADVEAVQRYVDGQVLGALYNGEREALQVSGWVQGLEEERRIAAGPRNLLNTGLRYELASQEYVVRQVLFLPKDPNRCVVIARATRDTTTTLVLASKPYGFLIEHDRGRWRVLDSGFLPDKTPGGVDPEQAFLFFEEKNRK